ncbi:hypothetical protein L484_008362 [Morus notabilis]|uniref:Uncharacterized protein n=1 Tax=Morus notabilis TaxID=981085 RepID=W9SLT9_9ROSA|nr:hypothetical protein L484_008362 [Morus notabilis]
MQKKAEEPFRTVIENGFKNRHRSMFVMLGDKHPHLMAKGNNQNANRQVVYSSNSSAMEDTGNPFYLHNAAYFSATSLQYIEPREHEKLSQVELLVVDEAAAIPLPAVWSLLGPYLVFRLSTVNGAGQILSLKLIQRSERQSQTSAHSLDGPTSEKLARCRYDLPKELWVEIMTRLPVYAQLRCKSVQKSWNRHINTLIRDKTFVAKHLKNSIDRPSLFIVSHHHLPSSEIGSHCNGIICLRGYSQNYIMLFNPALREFKLMKNSCFGLWDRLKQRILVGIGHDLNGDVYKVVRVFYGRGHFVGGEIHTLGIDNHDSWREVNKEERFCKAIAPGVMNQQLEHKGIIDWLARGGRPQEWDSFV